MCRALRDRGRGDAHEAVVSVGGAPLAASATAAASAAAAATSSAAAAAATATAASTAAASAPAAAAVVVAARGRGVLGRGFGGTAVQRRHAARDAPQQAVVEPLLLERGGQNAGPDRLGQHQPVARPRRRVGQQLAPPDDPRHKKYENRTLYRPYTRKTDWIEFLGFVMPKTEADTASFPSVPLSSVPGIVNVFRPGEKAEAGAIMVRK